MTEIAASAHSRMHVLLLAVAWLAVFAAQPLHGAEDPAGAGKPSPTGFARWKEECGACHIPFPPRFQPAGVWRAIMDGLDNHFGTDASLDDKAAAEIADHLELYAIGEGRNVMELYAYRASILRGERLFNDDHGKELRCISCHTANPAEPGRSERTGNTIEPLAPYANPERLVDSAKVERMFRRNCGYVLGRDCTPQEKEDVIAFLLTFKTPLRITETRWFRAKHAKVEPAVKNPDECQSCHTRPKSMSNCGLCHKQSENDNFIHHDVNEVK